MSVLFCCGCKQETEHVRIIAAQKLACVSRRAHLRLGAEGMGSLHALTERIAYDLPKLPCVPPA